MPAFESQALYRDNGFVTGDPGSAEGIRGMAVTTTFFDVLRTPPYRGHTFKDEDGVEGRNRVAILSYGFWRRASAGSDAAIGLGAGVAGTVALRQVIASQLYGVAALDPIVLASVSGVLVVAPVSPASFPPVVRRASTRSSRSRSGNHITSTPRASAACMSSSGSGLMKRPV